VLADLISVPASYLSSQARLEASSISVKEIPPMKLRPACLLAGFLSLALSLVQLAVAQTTTETASAVPRLVRLGGTVKDLNGNPLTGVIGITFALYSEPAGGTTLWLETQNVTADSNGHYVALLGSTKLDGLPTELFTSGQARWVGVQVSGQAEQPRVLLVSTPYALKAGDAETIGGLPPSAFVLANGSQGAGGVEGAAQASAGAQKNMAPPANPDVTGKGVVNYIPLWNTTSDIVDSLIFQKSSKIGINTTTPSATLDVNGNLRVTGAATVSGTGSFIASTVPQLIVNDGGSGTTTTGEISGNSSTASGSGGLYLAASNAVYAGNNTGLLFVGPTSGQWEQGPSTTGGPTNFMSIALNSSTTAAQNISFNTPVGVPVQTGRYGGNFTNTLDDGNNNMTALGWVWQKGRNYLQSNPPNPTGTSSTSFTMMGLGSTLKLTPDFSGTVIIKIDSEANNTTGDGNGILFEIFYGTGTAPSNGSSTTGTQVGPTFERDFWATPGGYATVGFGTNLKITGLTVGTPYWFDIALRSLGSGSSNATIQNIEFYVEEI
jgi:hypothetical protein